MTNKSKRVRIFGITNKLGNNRYAYFADYDNKRLAFVKKKLVELLNFSRASYGCIIRTRARHYHLIIPYFFKAHEIAAMHQLSGSDNAHIYYWFKHGRNAVRITKKLKNEKEYKLVHELQLNGFTFIPNKLVDFLSKAYGAFIAGYPKSCSIEFVEYSLDDGRGRAFTNRFFNSKEFKEWLVVLTENGALQ